MNASNNRFYGEKAAPTLDEAVGQIPPGWFLYGLGECVTPIIYAKDRHESKSSFWAELQHREGGRLTKAEGQTLALAVFNAVSTLCPASN